VALDNADGFFLKQLTATGANLKGRVIEISGRSAVHIAGVASRGAARVEGIAMHDGQPFAGAMIVLVPRDPGNNLPLFRRDQSDSDGTFTLSNGCREHTPRSPWPMAGTWNGGIRWCCNLT